VGGGAAMAVAVDRTTDFMEEVEKAKLSGKGPLPKAARGDGGDGAVARARNTHGASDVAEDGAAEKRGGDAALLSRAVAEVSADIAKTSLKLRELTNLVRNRSIFDDRSDRANALTSDIKDEVQALNRRLDDLQSFVDARQRAGASEQSRRHNESMVGSLKVQFNGLATKFKAVLRQRTSAMRAQSDRRARYGEERTLGRPLVYKPPPAPTAPTAGASGSGAGAGAGGGMTPSTRGLSPDGVRQRKSGAGGMALPRPGGVGGAGGGAGGSGGGAGGGAGADEVGAAFGQLEQSALAPRSYLETRASDVQDIESHIIDIGQIMNRLATFVGEQADMVSRVTDNIDDSMDNTQRAEGELTKYLQSVSSNKMLAFKVFLVIVTFIVLFVVFIA